MSGARTHIVRLLAGVNAQVALQSLQVAEAGATGVTGVRLLARMDQDVRPEVGHLQHKHTNTMRGVTHGVKALDKSTFVLKKNIRSRLSQPLKSSP